MFVLSFSLLKFPVPGLTFLRADTRVTSLCSHSLLLTSLFWLNIMTGYFWSLFFSQIVWDKKCCDTFISRQMRSSLWGCCEEWGVLPRPRLSPHWPGHRVSGQYAGTQPAPPGRPGAHCVHWKFYSRGNIKIFHKVSLMLILQLDAVVFVFWLSAWKFQNFVLH